MLINPRNFHYLPLHHAIAWVTPEAGETAKPRSQLTLRRLAERTRRVIEPEPSVVGESLDLEGNVVTYAWFSGRTRALRIVSTLSAETVRTNPFDDVPETVFAGLPVAYPEDQAALLQPHRETSEVAQRSQRSPTNWPPRRISSRSPLYGS